MLEFLTQGQEDVKIDGNVELSSEVVHLLYELGQEASHVVFFPGGIRSLEKVVPR